jgi:cysteine-rich repeat protein
MPRPHAILTLLAAFAVGAAPACRSFEVVNAQHCHHASGDQTCAERYDAERPFCVGPSDECTTADEYGCVADLPAIECYSPCGHGTLFDDDASCLDGLAEEDTAGDGDGDEPDPEPMCGNGIVEGDEECDDGNDVDDDDCTNACTLPVCGDGIVQEHLGETCDDGNTLAGDECAASCVLPGTIVWDRTYDFDECAGYAVALASDDTIVVAVHCTEFKGRVMGFDADGERVWDHNVMDSPLSVAVSPTDENAIVGDFPATSQAQLRYHGSNGAYSWHQNMNAIPSRFEDVAIAGNGEIVVVGSSGQNSLMRRYTPNGMLLWSYVDEDGGPFVAVAVNAQGRAWALQRNSSRIQTFSADGMAGWVSAEIGVSVWGRLAVDHEDNIFAVSMPDNTGDRFQVDKFDTDGTPLWTVVHDDESTLEIGRSLALVPTGGVLVVGLVGQDGWNGDVEGRLSWFTADGVHLQDVAYEGAGEGANFLWDVAVSDEGYAVAVGFQDTQAHSRLWIIKVAI